MRDNLLTLFLEINQLNFIFFVTKSDDKITQDSLQNICSNSWVSK